MQKYESWLLKWPAQNVLLTASLEWCDAVTSMFKVGGEGVPLLLLQAAGAVLL